MTEIDPSIGLRVRALRKAAGKPQRELAQDCGLSVPYLSELERGDKRWNTDNIEQVASALGVSPVLLQDPSIPLDRIHEIAEILENLAALPKDKLEVVTQLLQALRS